jgi:HK97 gp10 family phage protein
MIGISVDTSDLDQWGRLLASEAAEIVRRIEPAVKAQQAEVQSRAVSMAPHRTGALRGSIRPTGGGLKRRVRAGGGRAFYAHYQEFGTRKMSANPFLLRQANAQAAAEFGNRVERALAAGEVYR